MGAWPTRLRSSTRVANELDTWPGLRIEQRSDGVSVVRYHHAELGLLYAGRGEEPPYSSEDRA